MNPRDKAISLGHKPGSVLDAYDAVKRATLIVDNEDVSELDILYFLKNILWSSNFGLVAQIIKEYGYESRLDQWKQALQTLKTQSNEKVIDPGH